MLIAICLVPRPLNFHARIRHRNELTVRAWPEKAAQELGMIGCRIVLKTWRAFLLVLGRSNHACVPPFLSTPAV